LEFISLSVKIISSRMEDLKLKLERYIKKAEPSFAVINVISPEGEKVKDTASRYFSDAKHFLDKGEQVNAFAALEYAEGWLDAGVALRVISVKGKDAEDF
jgi:uncharacterized protein